MKRIIYLILSVAMIVYGVGGLTVNAAETVAVEARKPNIHIQAALIDAYFDNGAATDNGDGTLTSGGSLFKKVAFNTETNVHSQQLGLYNVSAPKAKATMARFVDTYIYDAATAPADLEPWEGIKVRADEAEVIGNIRESYGAVGPSNPGIAISTTAGLYNKDIRVDSIRFKLPERGTNTNAGVLLFGGTNSTYFSLQELNKHNALRILDGGAYTVDLSSGETGYRAFIPNDTILPNKWYRAERILDTRIDMGKDEDGYVNPGTENWHRYIIFEDETNTVVGDSGWVLAGTFTKSTAVTESYKSYPFTSVSFAPINYPTGSYAYFDDIKVWGIDTPTAEPDENWDSLSYLTFPTENDGILPGTDSSYRPSWGLGFSTHMYYYYGNYTSGAEYPYGIYGDHRAEKVKFQRSVLRSKYIYMQQDIMLPEVNTKELGFFDITQNQNYNTCYDDLTVDNKADAREYDGIGGVVRVNNGVLTVVSDYSSEKSGYTGKAKTEDKTADFSLKLETGKWYNIQLRIDQSAYVPFTCKADDGKTVDLDASTTPAKARVIVTDEDGNVYKTAEFTYKSPAQYVQYSIYQAVVLADIRRPNVSTGAVTGAKINIDNIKCVLSDGEIDAEGAIVFYEEDFENRIDGAAYNSFVTDKFNPQNSSYINGPSAYANDLAEVVVDDTHVNGVPTSLRLILAEDISSDINVLADSVRVYKGKTDVSDMVAGMKYDSNTNALDIEFSALEPNTEYTIVIDRNVTEIPGNIFSALPGTTGKIMEFKFTGIHIGKPLVTFAPEFVSGGSAIEENGIVSGVDITAGNGSKLQNAGTLPVNYVAFAVLYNDAGEMEDMMIQKGIVAPQTTIDLNFNGDSLTPDRATKLSAFVWNTWRLMDLIAAPYEYTAE